MDQARPSSSRLRAIAAVLRTADRDDYRGRCDRVSLQAVTKAVDAMAARRTKIGIEATPPAIVARLNAQINQALSAPELKQRLAAEGAIATPQPPEVFGKLIASEIARWKPVIGSGRVKVQ